MIVIRETFNMNIHPTTITLSIFTAFTLGTSCTVEEGSFDASEGEDESAGTTTDDGGDGDFDHWRSAGALLGSALGSPVVTDTTVSRTNSFGVPANCGSSNNTPDVWHAWTAPTAGTYAFTTANTTINSTFDTILHIRPVSNSSQVLGCNNNGSGLGVKSKVSLSLAQGAELMIVVDGNGTATGSYNLNITKTCPNNICDNGENGATCPQDCPCGNGVCGPGESYASCPQDCPPPCGDGICQPGQDHWSCPEDCPACGDGICQAPETTWSCAVDCCAEAGYQGICSGNYYGPCCNSDYDCGGLGCLMIVN
jgi:hypothetical protein